jgi:hypothetical protein
MYANIAGQTCRKARTSAGIVAKYQGLMWMARLELVVFAGWNWNLRQVMHLRLALGPAVLRHLIGYMTRRQVASMPQLCLWRRKKKSEGGALRWRVCC